MPISNSLTTFICEYCKLLNINLRKWFDIPCYKPTFPQKYMSVCSSKLPILVFGSLKLSGMDRFGMATKRLF